MVFLDTHTHTHTILLTTYLPEECRRLCEQATAHAYPPNAAHPDGAEVVPGFDPHWDYNIIPQGHFSLRLAHSLPPGGLHKAALKHSKL